MYQFNWLLAYLACAYRGSMAFKILIKFVGLSLHSKKFTEKIHNKINFRESGFKVAKAICLTKN